MRAVERVQCESGRQVSMLERVVNESSGRQCCV